MSPLTVLDGVNTIQVGGHRPCLVSSVDYPIASQHAWVATGRKRGLYVTAQRRKGGFCLHRLLVGNPAGMLIDHRNGDRFDNRRENLRPCTITENNRNKRKAWGSSKYKGVHWRKEEGKWKASLKIPGGWIQRCFASEMEAALYYDKVAREHFGEFACTNADLFGNYAEATP